MNAEQVRLKPLKPALSGYVREARRLLADKPGPGDRAVHDVRVLMKKARAVLKLVANQLPRYDTGRDIEALREVGRKMCLWRESAVMRKHFRQLKREFPAIFSRLEGNEKITSLLTAPDSYSGIDASIQSELGSIKELLRKAEYRIRFMPMNRLDPRQLIDELESSYLRVSDIYLSCRNDPKTRKLHEFRKRSKDLMYQLSFFRPLNPDAVRTQEKRIDIIASNLGRYNDLAQIIRAIEYRYERGINPPALDELIVRIREKQDGYLQKAWPGAMKVFRSGQYFINLPQLRMLVST